MKTAGTLTIESLKEGSEVILRIQDTGTGVPQEIQKKIFEPFFTTKSEGIGTGLGLSLSQKVVEKYGGKISLVSSSKQGTLFEIRMPRLRSSEKVPGQGQELEGKVK